jgi:hypothetical protein
VRAAFFALLFINLAFLGWAGWIDSPRQAPTSDATARLPKLHLVNEQPTAEKQGGDAAPGHTGGTAHKVAMTAAPTAAAATPAALPTQPPAVTPKCVSVGPFNDINVAAKAAGSLRDKGFSPVQRAEQGEAFDGYWVYISGVTDSDAADKAFAILDRNGIKDAHLMPGASDGRRISVGLFTERDRADKRAKLVEKMGLKAEVAERKQPATFYWVDLTLKPSDGSIPVGDLLAAGAGAGRLSVQSCPSSPSPQPAATPAKAPAEPATPGTRVPSTTVAGTPKIP